jgi:hypothetical protein
MNRAIHPPRPWPAPEPAAGCPAFGRDTVLERPDEDAVRTAPLRPGRYTLGGPTAPFDVTWWDPYKLHLDARLTFGKRQKALIDKHAPDDRVRDGLDAVDHWSQVHAARLAQGVTPSLRVQRVTDAARAVEAVGIDVRVERAAAGRARPSGRAFGAVVHEVLAAIPLDAADADVAAMAAHKARILGTTSLDLPAVTAAIGDTLRHPLLDAARRADAAGRCRRETPVMLRLEDGSIVEGQLDLAFEDADGWTVIDFKTDADLDGSLEVYQRQVALYARALAVATGRPARAVLLRI